MGVLLLVAGEDGPPSSLHAGKHPHIQGLHLVRGVGGQADKLDGVLLAELNDPLKSVV